MESNLPDGVQARPAQPAAITKIVPSGGNVYYIVGHIKVSQERYTFSLRLYLTQTATPIPPPEPDAGVMAKWRSSVAIMRLYANCS
ncbi:MAG: hypothetical protein U0401_18220 [Anaerolineae bacterium]